MGECVENSCANIVYSGVGKTEAEIENAIRSGVGCINLGPEIGKNDSCYRQTVRYCVPVSVWG